MVFEDMIRIQIIESYGTKEIDVINYQPNHRSKELWVRRSLSILIYILHMDDCSGCGTKFRPISMLQKVNEAYVLTWTLFLLLSGCPYLWHVVVDTRETPFKWNVWKVWVRTTTQSILF